MMAEDQSGQRGVLDDGREHVATAELLADPQMNPPPNATSSSSRAKTTSTLAADKKSGYYLKDLPRHERRRIEREIQKGRKPGESWDCSHV